METISSKFVDNILQDFRDIYLKIDTKDINGKISSIMSDLILLKSALEEREVKK